MLSFAAFLGQIVLNYICLPDHDGFGFGESVYAATLSHSASDVNQDTNEENLGTSKDLPIGKDIPSDQEQ